ncbi:hypothetical protein diail_4958 [Diaporthe ilicicola]|nr:hypothetical protein diail_4958 [Diaporthe ilicicola]
MDRDDLTTIGGAMEQLSLASDDQPELSKPATKLLSVLCFLDSGDVRQTLLFTGLKAIDDADMPRTLGAYNRARDELLAAGKIAVDTEQPHHKVVVHVAPETRAETVAAMSMPDRTRAFNAAATLLSSSWPFLDTYNATEVRRLRHVRDNIRHVAALRDAALELEAGAYVPNIRFCALLHEEAWLETMQTTVQDMHLGSWARGLPLAARLLMYHKRNALASAEGKEEYCQLVMRQARFQGVTASMLGKTREALDSLRLWVEMLVQRTGPDVGRVAAEDLRTLPFLYNEIGMHGMRTDPGDRDEAMESFAMALDAIEKERGPLDRVFNFLLPSVNYALMLAHNFGAVSHAEGMLSLILGEHSGRSVELRFDDTTSLETGIVIFAMATVKALDGCTFEAIEYCQRAVSVLEETHGKDAAFTLAALYRMAACLFKLGDYDEAMEALDRINRAYRDYGRTFDEAYGADMQLQKARALWKGGRTLKAIVGGKNHTKNESAEAEAQGMLDEAMKIRWDVTGLPNTEYVMDDEDWDVVVNFLYR